MVTEKRLSEFLDRHLSETTTHADETRNELSADLSFRVSYTIGTVVITERMRVFQRAEAHHVGL